MLDGIVKQISADVIDNKDAGAARPGVPSDPLQYRALVLLQQQQLNHSAKTLALSTGMQVHAEIHTGRRSVLDYLLSPIQKIAHEAGRER
jgi:HlyD family secretion protein